MPPKFMKWQEQRVNFVPGATTSGKNPTKIKNHTANLYTWDDGRQEIYLFGGYDGRKNHNDIHILDCNTLLWSKPKVHGDVPEGRNGHTTTLAQDSLYIQGGWLGRGPLAANDIHVFDILSKTWIPSDFEGEPPGPCNMHTSNYLDHKKSIFVFRGGDGKDYLNDLHILNIPERKWLSTEDTQVSGNVPSKRANHSSAVVGTKLCIFGGWDGKKRLNDIFVLDTDTLVWSKPNVNGRLPAPRAGMSFISVDNFAFLFGGSGAQATCFNDVQIFDLENCKWLSVAKEDPNAVHNANNYQDDGLGKSSAEFESRHGPREMQQSEYLINKKYFTASSDGNGITNSGISSSLKEDYNDDGGNPNSYDSLEQDDVLLQGKGPAHRAGHTATKVDRRIFLLGGSHGVEYKNDFYILDTDPKPNVKVSSLDSVTIFQQNLHKYLDNEEFSDISFLVDGRVIYAHKIVLCSQSDRFRAMFTSGFRESKEKQIEIDGMTADVFMVMMDYLYTGKTDEIENSLPDYYNNTENNNYHDNVDPANIERVCNVMQAADQFFLDRLKQICEFHLQKVVNEETLEYLLERANMCDAKQLEAVCSHQKRNLLFYQQLRKNNQLGYIVNDGLQEGSKMGTNVDKNKQKNVSPSTTTNLYEGSKKEEIAKLSRKK